MYKYPLLTVRDDNEDLPGQVGEDGGKRVHPGGGRQHLTAHGGRLAHIEM